MIDNNEDNLANVTEEEIEATKEDIKAAEEDSKATIDAEDTEEVNRTSPSLSHSYYCWTPLVRGGWVRSLTQGGRLSSDISLLLLGY